jgi:Domain of unknown function (DUF4118)
MDVSSRTMGESAGTRSTSRAALRQLAGPWRVFLFAGLGWLLISVVVLRFALASLATATVLVGAVVLLCASGGSRIAPASSGLPVRRRLAGYALAVVLAPLLTLLLAILRGRLDLTTDVLVFLVTVIAVALLGGLVPAVLEAIAGSLLLSAYFTSPRTGCCSDSGPVADEPQIPRTLPAPAGQGHSDSPGHAARAAGSGADALQTWFRPPGRQTRGRRVTWTKEAGA